MSESREDPHGYTLEKCDGPRWLHMLSKWKAMGYIHYEANRDCHTVMGMPLGEAALWGGWQETIERDCFLHAVMFVERFGRDR